MSQQNLNDLEETITVGRGTDAFAAADNLCGTTFAQKYQILELVGKGGMSAVYKVRHLAMDKIVALKVLHQHLSRDEISLRRFKQEAHAAASLHHPNIITTYDYGESENIPYLIMDFVDGLSLDDLLKKSGPLDLQEFVSIFQQVAAAIAQAHKQGVIHRDLKPSNIMIDRDKQARLVDFGIAKVLTHAEHSQHLTQTGEVFGSPLYMSPEQCKGIQVDARSDTYSLGCVMYEALSGAVPFKGETVFDTIYKHINEAPPRLVADQLEEPVRDKIEIMLLKAMAKLPDDRYASISQLEQDLRALKLQSKVGLLAALGNAWDKAAVKGRASRKNRMPLMVVTLLLVSCLSFASVAALLIGLQSAGGEIKRLEESRRIISQISIAQSDFSMLGDAAKPLVTSLIFHPELASENLKEFKKLRLVTISRLEAVEKSLQSNKQLLGKFLKDWKPRLIKLPHQCQADLERLASETPLDMSKVPEVVKLSGDGTKCTIILQKMSDQARAVEKEQLGQFTRTQQWIFVIGSLCLYLNIAVLVSLFVYFSKGSRRLKDLAEQAARLSRQRGMVQASNQDELADLDMVLQELATALDEAEERERLLREELKESKDA